MYRTRVCAAVYISWKTSSSFLLYTHTPFWLILPVCVSLFFLFFFLGIDQEHSSYTTPIQTGQIRRDPTQFFFLLSHQPNAHCWPIHPTKNKRENPLPNHKAYTIDKRSSSFFIIIIEGYRLYRPSLGGFNIYIPLIATCSFLYYYILLYNI